MVSITHLRKYRVWLNENTVKCGKKFNILLIIFRINYIYNIMINFSQKGKY